MVVSHWSSHKIRSSHQPHSNGSLPLFSYYYVWVPVTVTVAAERGVTPPSAPDTPVLSATRLTQIRKRRFQLKTPSHLPSQPEPASPRQPSERAAMDSKCSSTSPQKQILKNNRSKSTEEVQQAKKAFHTPQKSLPGRPDLEKLKETPEGSETPSASTEELK
ncbi:hypothetical protein COCON_G00041000 [Conger conger]|uniref:Uncharacterized protein n=1 Tax=Conger conger TaxID=82655 RepID=A0A9Q1I4K1_CONCO|nr:hypothetical protein COCON_G00041000 [Conger conger]